MIKSLNVLERVLLGNLLPKEGSFANLKLLRVARENLSFDDKENKALNFRQEGEQMRWDNAVVINKKSGKTLTGDPEYIQKTLNRNPDEYETKPAVPDKDVEIGEVATQMIEKALKELDEKGELKDEHVSLFEKFIEQSALAVVK